MFFGVFSPVCFVLSVPVQVIASKDLSLVWPVKLYSLTYGANIVMESLHDHIIHYNADGKCDRAAVCSCWLLQQYLFSDSTTDFFVDLIVAQGKRRVLCVGTPRYVNGSEIFALKHIVFLMPSFSLSCSWLETFLITVTTKCSSI